MNKVSTKPYLLRALYEWCIDQGYTPHIAVLVDAHTRVPPGYAQDGQIVLNLAPEATHQLAMGNDFITFQARFGGVAHPLSIPVGNVIAIYARENGQGMAFEPEPLAADEAESGGPTADEAGGEAAPEPPSPEGGPGGAPRTPGERGSHLKVVK